MEKHKYNNPLFHYTIKQLVDFLKEEKFYLPRKTRLSAMKNALFFHMRDEYDQLNQSSQTSQGLNAIKQKRYERLQYLDTFCETQLETEMFKSKNREIQESYVDYLWHEIKTVLMKINIDSSELKALVDFQGDESQAKILDCKLLHTSMNSIFFDEKDELDGVHRDRIKDVLIHSSTIEEIVTLGKKYRVYPPTRMKKEEVKQVIVDELKKRDSFTEVAQEQIQTYTLKQLEEFAEVHQIAAKHYFTKEQVLDYVLQHAEFGDGTKEEAYKKRISILNDEMDEKPMVEQTIEFIPQPIEICSSVYYVGENSETRLLHSNPYLLVDGDEGVLFEPGSTIEFSIVKANIEAIMPLKQIRYVVLTHADPDVAAAMPLLESAGMNATIVSEWKSRDLLTFYALESPYYLIEQNQFQLVLSSGRVLRFIPTPFTHSPGAFMTYDEQTKTVFSGDLFGGYGQQWTLYAQENYYSLMVNYHELHMPSSDFIRPAIKKLRGLSIDRICPQHGSIIQGELVGKMLKKMQMIDFYNTETSYKTTHGTIQAFSYLDLCNQALRRLQVVYGEEIIYQTFEGTNFKINPEHFEIETNMEQNYKLWNLFFEILYHKNDISWLSLLEPFVHKISQTYDIQKPAIYRSTIVSLSQLKAEVDKEKEELKEEIHTLKERATETSDQLLHCPVTKLYNEVFFRRFMLNEEMAQCKREANSIGILFVSIDDLARINRQFGVDTGNQTLINAGYILEQIAEEQEMVFKYVGATFVVLLMDTDKSKFQEKADKIRNAITDSDTFIEKISVSIAIVMCDEVKEETLPNERLEKLIAVGNSRLIIARTGQHGSVIDTDTHNERIYDGYALLIDEDEVNQNVILRIFERENYQVMIAKDVYEAIQIIENKKIDIIMSEINISKLDGFALKQQLNESTEYRVIPYIMVSHNKNTETIIRANSLGVDYILRKPIYPEELMGLIKRYRERKTRI